MLARPRYIALLFAIVRTTAGTPERPSLLRQMLLAGVPKYRQSFESTHRDLNLRYRFWQGMEIALI